MLTLQVPELTNPQARELLKQSQTRIRSIALLPEKLYGAPSLAHVDVAGYLFGTATSLTEAYSVTDDLILTVGAEDLWLGMDAALSCGLIVNELLSNALKHDLPCRQKGGSGGRPASGGRRDRPRGRR